MIEKETYVAPDYSDLYVGWGFTGGFVCANGDDKRLEVYFDYKPNEEIRNDMKRKGFRYDPVRRGWMRTLNDETIRITEGMDYIEPDSGMTPSEMQEEFRRRTAEEDARENDPAFKIIEQPTVTILQGKNQDFRVDETMNFYYADTLVRSADRVYTRNGIQHEIKYRIDYMMDGEQKCYEGTESIGDGKGNLVDRIEDEKLADWLYLHNELSLMECFNEEASQSRMGNSKAQNEYCNAVREYISQCRAVLNQGGSELPPAPVNPLYQSAPKTMSSLKEKMEKAKQTVAERKVEASAHREPCKER